MLFTRKKFFDAYRLAFDDLNQTQVDGLNFLLGKFEEDKWTDLRLVAYCLATVKHETAATFQPVKEKRERSTSTRRANQDRYWKTGFYGRGFVQLTHRENYAKLGREISADLLSNPELAYSPDIAFEILVVGMLRGLFTGQKLSDYINAFGTDYTHARRIVNGMDKASLISSYAQKFERTLKLSEGAAEKSAPAVKESADTAEDAPNAGMQTAENITNVTTGAGKTVPDNFQPELKTMDAPAPSGVSARLKTWLSYLGIGVPSLAAVGTAAKGLYADGAINLTEIVSVVAATFKQVLPYSAYIVLSFVAYKIVKEGSKQISFIVRMIINARADMHDIQIAAEDAPTASPK